MKSVLIRNMDLQVNLNMKHPPFLLSVFYLFLFSFASSLLLFIVSLPVIFICQSFLHLPSLPSFIYPTACVVSSLNTLVQPCNLHAPVSRYHFIPSVLFHKYPASIFTLSPNFQSLNLPSPQFPASVVPPPARQQPPEKLQHAARELQGVEQRLRGLQQRS